MTPSWHPGFVRIGRICSANRRSLWFKENKVSFELRAGREGDDQHVVVDRSNPQFDELRELFRHQRDSMDIGENDDQHP